VQARGSDRDITVAQLRHARPKCDPAHTVREQPNRAPIFEPTEVECKFLLDNKAMTDKALVAAFNANFRPVRATADGRRRPSGPVGGGRAHPRAAGGVRRCRRREAASP
jgi:hypothetical protein